MRITITVLAFSIIISLLYGGKLFQATAPSASTTSLPAIAIQPVIDKPIKKIPVIAAQARVVQTMTPSPVPTLTPTPTSNPSPTTHLYYTSSHWKAKYYYCDSDKDRLTLSKDYIKIFSSVAELLQAYPNHALHQPCK